MPVIAEKRVLKCKSPAARVELDAAFAQTLLGFRDGGGEKWIGHAELARIASYSNTFGPRSDSCATLTIARATVAA